jgi:hypothetical protein
VRAEIARRPGIGCVDTLLPHAVDLDLDDVNATIIRWIGMTRTSFVAPANESIGRDRTDRRARSRDADTGAVPARRAVLARCRQHAGTPRVKSSLHLGHESGGEAVDVSRQR